MHLIQRWCWWKDPGRVCPVGQKGTLLSIPYTLYEPFVIFIYIHRYVHHEFALCQTWRPALLFQSPQQPFEVGISSIPILWMGTLAQREWQSWDLNPGVPAARTLLHYPSRLLEDGVYCIIVRIK